MFLPIKVYFGLVVTGQTLPCSVTFPMRAVGAFIIQSLPETLHFRYMLAFNHIAITLQTSVP